MRYFDQQGVRHDIEADGLFAACLQHEIDHLDGVLALDRASGGEGSLVMRTVFEAAPARYQAEGDYTIAQPTRSNRPPPPAGA